MNVCEREGFPIKANQVPVGSAMAFARLLCATKQEVLTALVVGAAGNSEILQFSTAHRQTFALLMLSRSLAAVNGRYKFLFLLGLAIVGGAMVFVNGL